MKKREIERLQRLKSDRLSLTEVLSILDKLEDEISKLIAVIEDPDRRFPLDDLATFSSAIERIQHIGGSLQQAKNKRHLSTELKSFSVQHELSCKQLRDSLADALRTTDLEIQVLESA